MPSQPRFIKDHKQRGEWAELRFMARAAEHGLSVSKPWGDSQRYDVTVEHNGRFLRVQVKSTVAKFCEDRKSTRLNSSHPSISYAVFCLKKKNERDLEFITTVGS